MGRIPSPAHVLLREYRINQSVYSVIQLFVLESLNKLYHKFIYPQIVFNSSTSRAYSEIPKVYDAQRGINYDINCTFADGEKAQVEMQSWDEGYAYGKRAEYYAARLLSSVIDVGDDWDKIPQVYQISVLDFRFDKTNDEPIHHYIMCDRKDGAKLTERLNVIFMELPKIPKTERIEDVKTLPPVIKWCKFLEEADKQIIPCTDAG